jgi:hypothetical protein
MAMNSDVIEHSVTVKLRLIYKTGESRLIFGNTGALIGTKSFNIHALFPVEWFG